jgi:cellulose synthase/poly-beta-1,6-N-acetylglucosamine synthase-like glycosyltransferase
MVRAAQGFFRLVNIIPGPIGLFRVSAMRAVGGYDHDTFAEDCDLTLKLLAEGWQIHYEPESIAYTEAPEKLLDLLKQRYRWTRGILQAIRKHREFLRRPAKDPAMAFTLAYMVFEGILWPSMNVFAHLLFVIVATRFGAALPLVLWWAQLTVLDLAAALYCVAVEEERLSLVPYAILYARSSRSRSTCETFCDLRGAAPAAHGLGQARADRKDLTWIWCRTSRR